MTPWRMSSLCHKCDTSLQGWNTTWRSRAAGASGSGRCAVAHAHWHVRSGTCTAQIISAASSSSAAAGRRASVLWWCCDMAVVKGSCWLLQLRCCTCGSPVAQCIGCMYRGSCWSSSSSGWNSNSFGCSCNQQLTNRVCRVALAAWRQCL